MDKNIYSSPESDLEVSPSDDDILATRLSRLLASLIDTLTIIPITIPLMYFTGGFDGLTEGNQPPMTYTLTIGVITIAIFLLIHGKIILRDGQTWGKRVLKIKIVTVDNQHADLNHLMKRYGFYWFVPQIPFVGQFISIINILFIFSSSKRCLHDHIGGTKVVIAS